MFRRLLLPLLILLVLWPASVSSAQSGTPIGTIFRNERVWGFDAPTQKWQLYDLSAPQISDLTYLEPKKGYWVKSNGYSQVPGYTLYQGWNLIGWQASTTLRNPTYSELLTFLEQDRTDELPSIENKFVSGDFAITLRDNALKAGFRSAWVGLELGPVNGHGLNAFQTTDKGLVYIEPQADAIVYLEVGQPYKVRYLDVDKVFTWWPELTITYIRTLIWN